MWRFDVWYYMFDLVDVCGGKIMVDFQVFYFIVIDMKFSDEVVNKLKCRCIG